MLTFSECLSLTSVCVCVCVCVCVFFWSIYTISTSIICVSQEEPSLIASKLAMGQPNNSLKNTLKTGKSAQIQNQDIEHH